MPFRHPPPLTEREMPLAETNKKPAAKKATSPTNRKQRTTKPGTFLAMVRNLMEEHDLKPGDEIQGLIDALEDTIIAEAIAGS